MIIELRMKTVRKMMRKEKKMKMKILMIFDYIIRISDDGFKQSLWLER